MNLSSHPAPGVGPAPAPAVLVLPGGGYEMLADHEAEPVADWLNGLGLHAFVLRYPVAPARHPEPLDAGRAALRHIRTADHPGFRVVPDRVAVLGFSAGGHLAASLAGSDEPPNLSVLCYPVISLTVDAPAGSLHNLLGPSPGPEELAANSAETRVHAGTPPAFLWHTADDDAVPVSHSLRYAEALGRLDIPYELHVFPSGAHGLGLAQGSPRVAAWPGLCRDWLAGHGWLPDGAAPRPAG
ncbi:alpha/beta hydrolase [Streptomyces sp. DSM 44915]|uniref:Alpha/beta hydrolase n=1 Tax=Streptomyces chisholmiae TaxID=3075540 RepID=A0ABU2JXQ7_9ACTN|nr:alpha/beta hydrolase [Streptomyces sp. DSM 44915]MDT0269732.1 alpha/beta hydrolase [Streptomyces sp. DSM 44915]